ncbi:MAG: hypothetical protein H0Z16_05020 [Thermodesulfobacterium sp.]|nr:hypothetical protein [Thermodesulfobacterium sp.]MCD6548301.1 hypothetical protein [Thermodesulfobacterium sp.]HEA83845.1 hypothetical protein [Thermodesulfobacterium geofontis]
MKKTISIIFLVILFLVGSLSKGFSQKNNDEETFYKSSLHFYARGMAHWYSKENGGIEKLTCIPYDKLACNHCHAKTCDRCHKVEVNGKFAYSVKKAKSMKNCLGCHAREKMLLGVFKKKGLQDVHFSKGLECINCHTAREIHGDGEKYISMREQGAMDTKCENCHQERPATVSHRIHKDKLDCTACHVRQVITCANCHMDTFLKTGKKTFIPLRNWIFLVNYNGKVVSGNIQTFVVNKNQTFIIYAPFFSHDVVKTGRKCEECHATDIVKQISKGKIKITWIEKGTLTNLKGVIPIVEGVKYKNAYMEYVDGKWIPLENPEEPMHQFVAFGKPLTKSQLRKLMMPFKSKK